MQLQTHMYRYHHTHVRKALELASAMTVAIGITDALVAGCHTKTTNKISEFSQWTICFTMHPVDGYMDGTQRPWGRWVQWIYGGDGG